MKFFWKKKEQLPYASLAAVTFGMAALIVSFVAILLFVYEIQWPFLVVPLFPLSTVLLAIAAGHFGPEDYLNIWGLLIAAYGLNFFGYCAIGALLGWMYGQLKKPMRTPFISVCGLAFGLVAAVSQIMFS
ncbi:MAG: hypothetical protein JWM56_385 [Candidatus Peribacteria bacterium]|nr:hypothetical protein [Candidatus Peribacteria bacterium]